MTMNVQCRDRHSGSWMTIFQCNHQNQISPIPSQLAVSELPDLIYLHYLAGLLKVGRFEWRARIHRRGAGPTAYVRTWFSHHDRARRCTVWREFQLDEWPHHWRRRLQELWRDQIDADADARFGWVQPDIPIIPGWENHLGDIIVWQPGLERRVSILCHTLCHTDEEDRIMLQALSVPVQQGRRDLLRLNYVMIQCWTHPCTVRRGDRALVDGRIDHQDVSGLSIRVDPIQEDPPLNLLQQQVRLKSHYRFDHDKENASPNIDNTWTFSPTSPVAHSPPAGPLSEMAVLNTGENAAAPGHITWKGLSDRRQAQVSIAGIHPQDDASSDTSEDFIHIDENSDEDANFVPPDITPPGSSPTEDHLQSAMLFEQGHRERHARLRWHSHPALRCRFSAWYTFPLHH